MTEHPRHICGHTETTHSGFAFVCIRPPHTHAPTLHYLVRT